ncbi:hypothetical protein Efla_007092 [Eimeria flavescens]
MSLAVSFVALGLGFVAVGVAAGATSGPPSIFEELHAGRLYTLQSVYGSDALAPVEQLFAQKVGQSRSAWRRRDPFIQTFVGAIAAFAAAVAVAYLVMHCFRSLADTDRVAHSRRRLSEDSPPGSDKACTAVERLQFMLRVTTEHASSSAVLQGVHYLRVWYRSRNTVSFVPSPASNHAVLDVARDPRWWFRLRYAAFSNKICEVRLCTKRTPMMKGFVQLLCDVQQKTN